MTENKQIWLGTMNVELTPSNDQQMRVQENQELYQWGIQMLAKGYRVGMRASSGEGDPFLWNRCEEKILEYFEKGGLQEHYIGPLICTVNYHHILLEMKRKYPKQIQIFVSRTRWPDHWRLLATNNCFFKLIGEAYHEPMAQKRSCYKVECVTADDEKRFEKLGVRLLKEQEFEIQKKMGEELKDLSNISNFIINEDELKSKIKIARNKGLLFDVLSRDEIRGLTN